MKFREITTNKEEVEVFLQLSQDFKNIEGQVIYTKDAEVGKGKAIITYAEIPAMKDGVKSFQVGYFLYFKSFIQNANISPKHILLSSDILNSQKIGLCNDTLKKNNFKIKFAGKVKGPLVDKDTKKQECSTQVIAKFIKDIEEKINQKKQVNEIIVTNEENLQKDIDKQKNSKIK